MTYPPLPWHDAKTEPPPVGVRLLLEFSGYHNVPIDGRWYSIQILSSPHEIYFGLLLRWCVITG